MVLRRVSLLLPSQSLSLRCQHLNSTGELLELLLTLLQPGSEVSRLLLQSAPLFCSLLLQTATA